MKRKALKAAFPLTLPVMAGYLFLGLGFGILLASKGFSFLWAAFMSIIIYAGSMQYVAIDLLAAGASFLTTAIMTVMIQIRHLFYGLSLIVKYKDVGKKKWMMIYELTDETYSLIATSEPPEGIDAGWFYFFISLLDHSYWICGCTLGALFGSLVKFNTKGVDFVMTALFLVLFINQWLDTREHRPALIGVGCSILCLIFFGADNFIVPAMLSILAILSIFRKTLDKEEEKHADS
ncbi:AzlC family ABC transporter permease [Lachnospiraceae bacterium 46-15]